MVLARRVPRRVESCRTEKKVTRPMSKRLTSTLILAAAAVLSWSASHAAPPPDPARGKTIAQRWCAECHVVSPNQARAKADVPTFGEIAERRAKDPVPIEQFLMNPHPKMPDMQLTRSEIADIVAYIKTQKK
jgi:mono/diheme cytochrome c family protein